MQLYEIATAYKIIQCRPAGPAMRKNAGILGTLAVWRNYQYKKFVVFGIRGPQGE